MWRDIARTMGDELDVFLSLSLEVRELQERELSRQAITIMLHLIQDMTEYFCNYKGKGAFSKIVSLLAPYLLKHVLADFLASKSHQERTAHFKKQFELAKDQFDRNVQIETLRMIYDLCKLPEYLPRLCTDRLYCSAT